MPNLKDFFVDRSTSFTLHEAHDGSVIIQQWDRESVSFLNEDVENQDDDVVLTEMTVPTLEDAFKKMGDPSPKTKESVRRLWNEAAGMEMKIQVWPNGGVDIVTED